MAEQQKVVLWSIERRHFQKYLERLLSAVSKWRHSFTLNISKYRHNFNGILWIYTRPTQQCHFEWPWDLAKYSMARSDARSLCDSWASSLWQQLLDNVKFIVKNSYSELNWTDCGKRRQHNIRIVFYCVAQRHQVEHSYLHSWSTICQLCSTVALNTFCNEVAGTGSQWSRSQRTRSAYSELEHGVTLRRN